MEFTPGQPLERHPAYEQQSRARAFWRRSDAARWDYADGHDAAGRAILPKHERETDDRFSRRRGQAIVRRYARPIIDRFNDYACRQPVERADATGDYATLLADADGAGTPLPVFMRRALRKAQVESVAYLLADANDEGVYLSSAQEAAAGKRGILRLVSADQVLWWRDWSGQVVEALVHFVARDGRDFAWHVTETTTQRIWLKRENATAGLLVDVADEVTPHGYGGCPLVRLAPVFDDEAASGDDSQCAPLAEAQKRICNIDSWLLEELQGCTFTTQVFIGVHPAEVKDVTVGPNMALCLPGNGDGKVSLGKIGSDVAQAESLRQQLSLEIRELYRAAGLASGNPTEVGQPESGVAKAFQFHEVEAKLSALADAAEHTENLAVQRLADGLGWTAPAPARWPEDFAASDLAAELERTIRTITTSALPAVLKRAQVEQYAAKAFDLSPEQQQQLQEELDAMGEQPTAEPMGQVLPFPPARRMPGT